MKIKKPLFILALAHLFILLAPTALAERPALPVLVYHQIRTSGVDPADSATSISLERFTSQMHYLHAQGYTTLSMDEVVKFLDGQPFPAKIVAIHFDDGWKSALSAAPVLEKFQFKATFWIIAGSGIGLPHMEWSDINALAENPRFDIFSHTMTHPWNENHTLVDWVNGATAGKSLAHASFELTESRRILEKQLGRPVPYLAWPRGLYNGMLIALAQKAGYRALLTIDDGMNHVGDNPLRIHRTMIDGACDNRVFGRMLRDGKSTPCSTEPVAHSHNDRR